jgi:cell division protein FtsX
MLLHLAGAEKIRMRRLFIAKLAQKGIAAGMAPVAIQALENGILIYNINPWVLLLLICGPLCLLEPLKL